MKLRKMVSVLAAVLALSMALSLGATAKHGPKLVNGTPKIWARLVSEMKTAEPGDEVYASVGNVVFIPLEVIDALSATEGVKLKLRFGDAKVMTILSEDAPTAEKGQKYWDVLALKEMFPPKSTLRVYRVNL